MNFKKASVTGATGAVLFGTLAALAPAANAATLDEFVAHGSAIVNSSNYASSTQRLSISVDGATQAKAVPMTLHYEVKLRNGGYGPVQVFNFSSNDATKTFNVIRPAGDAFILSVRPVNETKATANMGIYVKVAN